MQHKKAHAEPSANSQAETKRTAFRPMPAKVSTDVALVAVSIALFLAKVVASNSPSVITRIFREGSNGEPVLVEQYFDRGGRWLSGQIDVFPPNHFEESISLASEMIVLFHLLERYAKFHTDQTTFNFCYTAVRCLPFLSAFPAYEERIIEEYGKDYYCPLAWVFAFEIPKSKVAKEWKRLQRLMDESSSWVEKGLQEKNRGDWKLQLENSARSRWNERQANFPQITKKAEVMRLRFQTKFG